MADDVRTTDELAGAAEPADESVQDPKTGGKSTVPIWVLVVVVALVLACACAMMVTGAGVVGILSSQQPDAPVIIVPPTQEQPAAQPPEQPTQPPPQQPTEAPPEQPAEPPPEQPAEPEAGQQPPEAGQLPTEPDTGGSSCMPLAGGLVLVPLLVLGRKTGNKISSGR